METIISHVVPLWRNGECSSKIHHAFFSSYFLLLGFRPSFVDGSLHLVVTVRVDFLQHAHQSLAGVCVFIDAGFTVNRREEERNGRDLIAFEIMPKDPVKLGNILLFLLGLFFYRGEELPLLGGLLLAHDHNHVCFYLGRAGQMLLRHCSHCQTKVFFYDPSVYVPTVPVCQVSLFVVKSLYTFLPKPKI